MRKPLIGLTSTRSQNSEHMPTSAVNREYARSISSAGGLPVLIPLELPEDDLDALLERLDGVLFTGGGDIDPRKYSGRMYPRSLGVNSGRDQVEFRLVQCLMQADKPFLGICRGIQVINVALGGSLYEDLPELRPGETWHDNHDKPRDYLAHSVRVENGSRMAHILGGREAQVNSMHHQGLRDLSSQLHPTAFAPDDLVEAIEVPGVRFGLAVQWHPEELQDHPSMRKLFQEFIQACSDSDPR